MEMIDNIQKAIDYIETNIVDDLSIASIASQACMSTSHFQRVFLAVCGVSVGDYIRSRKLALAGKEIINTNAKIIDIAYKYGYETPEGFSRAFNRFHNVSPTEARSQGEINTFTKISIISMFGKEDDMKNIVENTQNAKGAACSFCKRYHNEVQVLVAGKDVCICNECVSICNKVIEENLIGAS
ncbi:MAG: helix-turn-helix domain-containing protein [Defluviitaleaceae bacterium]|nr:helix-turn-helix domain-containing protein [Defluviitaleaceae bacterium]